MAEIRVPTLGESVTEATIGKWFKKPGDAVAVDHQAVLACVAGPAHAGAVVRAPDPGVIDDGIATVYFQIDQRPAYPGPADAKENVLDERRRPRVGRVGRPQDVAAAVCFLAGDGASYMTGQMLVLDGGGPMPFPLPRPEESP